MISRMDVDDEAEVVASFDLAFLVSEMSVVHTC